MNGVPGWVSKQEGGETGSIVYRREFRGGGGTPRRVASVVSAPSQTTTDAQLAAFGALRGRPSATPHRLDHMNSRSAKRSRETAASSGEWGGAGSWSGRGGERGAHIAALADHEDLIEEVSEPSAVLYSETAGAVLSERCPASQLMEEVEGLAAVLSSARRSSTASSPRKPASPAVPTNPSVRRRSALRGVPGSGLPSLADFVATATPVTPLGPAKPKNTTPVAGDVHSIIESLVFRTQSKTARKTAKRCLPTPTEDDAGAIEGALAGVTSSRVSALCKRDPGADLDSALDTISTGIARGDLSRSGSPTGPLSECFSMCRRLLL
jgi:hypothetical protein